MGSSGPGTVATAGVALGAHVDISVHRPRGAAEDERSDEGGPPCTPQHILRAGRARRWRDRLRLCCVVQASWQELVSTHVAQCRLGGSMRICASEGFCMEASTPTRLSLTLAASSSPQLLVGSSARRMHTPNIGRTPENKCARPHLQVLVWGNMGVRLLSCAGRLFTTKLSCVSTGWSQRCGHPPATMLSPSAHRAEALESSESKSGTEDRDSAAPVHDRHSTSALTAHYRSSTSKVPVKYS